MVLSKVSTHQPFTDRDRVWWHGWSYFRPLAGGLASLASVVCGWGGMGWHGVQARGLPTNGRRGAGVGGTQLRVNGVALTPTKVLEPNQRFRGSGVVQGHYLRVARFFSFCVIV